MGRLRKAARGAFHNDQQKALADLLRRLAHRHGLWQVFRDFAALSALAISNRVDRSQFDPREAEYLAIARRYQPDEMRLFAEGLGCVIEGLAAGFQDFLGSLYMLLELGDTWKGQIFTPYSVSLMLAKMTCPADSVRAIIGERGFVSVADPCVGGGALLIAVAQALHEEGIAYQTRMHATAQDIDLLAVHMAYVQLSLLHVPAVVIHGDSIAGEVRSVWRTPAHVWGGWEARTLPAIDAPQREFDAVPPAAAPIVLPPAPPPLVRPGAAAQFSLFD